MNVEVPTIKTNAGLVKAASDAQLLKQAMDNSTYFIREKVREKGFARKLVEPINVTAADLDRVSGSEQPAIILEKDIEATAMTVPFRGQGESRYWERENPIVEFQKIEVPKYSKSKFELMTSKTPYTKILETRFVQEAQKVEDETMIEAFNKMINDANKKAPGSQLQHVSGGLNKENISVLIKMLTRLRMVPTNPKDGVPKFLMTQTLKADLVNLGMIEIGDKNVTRNWEEGTLGVDKLFGLPVVTTIKNDLVKDNEMYIVAPQDYFGRFFILQDHTLVIKTEADMMEMWTYAAMGMGFINTKGVCKIVLD
jgi:hypothetical protein